MIKHASTEDMNTLSTCVNKLVAQGYSEELKPTENGLMKALSTSKIYKPEDVQIVNFFRFEGASDPDDNSILYAIETNDGIKATLVDVYGANADVRINEFVVAVQEIQKKNAKTDPPSGVESW